MTEPLMDPALILGVASVCALVPVIASVMRVFDWISR